ncbi:hypothetical protein [Kitasatospora sp. MBT63]|nr:hypothetical protein [Kitasatospora sp. MBT63]
MAALRFRLHTAGTGPTRGAVLYHGTRFTHHERADLAGLLLIV